MPSFTLDQLMQGSEDSTGFCINCGEENFGVEPDATGYSCQNCGSNSVMGAEIILVSFPHMVI